MTHRLTRMAALTTLVVTIGGPLAATQERGAADLPRQIRFGAEMARQGNWREAIFRWERALALDPKNPRLHNNLAVAWEFLGQYGKADAAYRAALEIPSVPREVRENYELFQKFYERHREGTAPAAQPAAEPPPGGSDAEPH